MLTPFESVAQMHREFDESLPQKAASSAVNEIAEKFAFLWGNSTLILAENSAWAAVAKDQNKGRFISAFDYFNTRPGLFF